MHRDAKELVAVVANVDGAPTPEQMTEMNRVISSSCTLLVRDEDHAECSWCAQTSVGERCNSCGRDFVFIARFGGSAETDDLTDIEIQCLRTGPIYIGRVTGRTRHLQIVALNPRWLDFVS